jgi:hypothetical protein
VPLFATAGFQNGSKRTWDSKPVAWTAQFGEKVTGTAKDVGLSGEIHSDQCRSQMNLQSKGFAQYNVRTTSRRKAPRSGRSTSGASVRVAHAQPASGSRSQTTHPSSPTSTSPRRRRVSRNPGAPSAATSSLNDVPHHATDNVVMSVGYSVEAAVPRRASRSSRRSKAVCVAACRAYSTGQRSRPSSRRISTRKAWRERHSWRSQSVRVRLS